MTSFSPLKLTSGCWCKGKTISQWLCLQGSKTLNFSVKKGNLEKKKKKKEGRLSTPSLNKPVYTHSSWINANAHVPTESVTGSYCSCPPELPPWGRVSPPQLSGHFGSGKFVVETVLCIVDVYVLNSLDARSITSAAGTLLSWHSSVSGVGRRGGGRLWRTTALREQPSAVHQQGCHSRRRPSRYPELRKLRTRAFPMSPCHPASSASGLSLTPCTTQRPLKTHFFSCLLFKVHNCLQPRKSNW